MFSPVILILGSFKMHGLQLPGFCSHRIICIHIFSRYPYINFQLLSGTRTVINKHTMTICWKLCFFLFWTTMVEFNKGIKMISEGLQVVIYLLSWESCQEDNLCKLDVDHFKIISCSSTYYRTDTDECIISAQKVFNRNPPFLKLEAGHNTLYK